jgi:hypothetical protein
MTRQSQMVPGYTALSELLSMVVHGIKEAEEQDPSGDGSAMFLCRRNG